MLVILLAELLPTSMEANMFATKCGHRTKGIVSLYGGNWLQLNSMSYRIPYTDNQATAKIVEVGSMKFEWHTPALRIVKICCEHSIHLDIEWVPRDCNTKADFISKLSGPWGCFQRLVQLLGFLYGGLFVTYYNREVVRYLFYILEPRCTRHRCIYAVVESRE